MSADKDEVEGVGIVCGNCGKNSSTTEQLLADGKARCPWCGHKVGLPEDFMWDSFHQMIESEQEIPSSVVHQAIFELKNDVDVLKGLNEDPINFVMETFTALYVANEELNSHKEAWAKINDALESLEAGESSKGELEETVRIEMRKLFGGGK